MLQCFMDREPVRSSCAELSAGAIIERYTTLIQLFFVNMSHHIASEVELTGTLKASKLLRRVCHVM